MEFTWSDKMGHRGRKPWCLLVQGGEIREFTGESIPGLVAVVGTSRSKNGKWSATTYRLELAGGVRAIGGLDGWETGRFAEGLRAAASFQRPIDRWLDVAEALGTSVTEAMRFLRAWRPRAAEALDAVDAALEAVENEGDCDVATFSASFGSPTRRQRDAGFWTAPHPIQGVGGVFVALRSPERGWEEGNVFLTDGGQELMGEVLGVERASGHGGGYVTVKVALPVRG